MEEEIIRKSFCNYCINKGQKCLKIEVVEKNNIKIYKCINYTKGDILPFYNNDLSIRI